MDPIGVLVQVKHRRMIHQMVAFLKGTYVSFNKSWEEDTLQKTEACETGSFQKLRWTWKDLTIAEKRIHRLQNPAKPPHNSFTVKENLRNKSHFGNTWNPHITPFAAELQAHWHRNLKVKKAAHRFICIILVSSSAKNCWNAWWKWAYGSC